MIDTKDSQFLYISDFEGNLKKISIPFEILEKNYGRLGEDKTYCILLLQGSSKILISSYNKLKLFSTADGQMIKDYGQIHSKFVKSMVLNDDYTKLFTSSAELDGYLKEWCSEDMKLKKSVKISGNKSILTMDL